MSRPWRLAPGLILVFLAALPLFADENMWKFRPATESAVHKRFGRQPVAFRTVAVDDAALRNALARAPRESTFATSPQILEVDRQPATTLTLPLPDGSFTRISIEESPIFSPEMQAQFPEIRTYVGQGIDDPTITARLDYTPLGFHAQLIGAKDTAYIDPASAKDVYVAYWHRDLGTAPFRCDYRKDRDGAPDLRPPGDTPMIARPEASFIAFPNTNPTGTQLRTYRLAVSVTGEYGAFFGSVANANAQIATTMNRVTGVYERDLTIRFNLVATRVYTDGSTDPFTGDDVSVMRGENQTELDTNVGSGNYDLGHIMGAGGSGGIASLGVACSAGNKARGATSLGNPSGDGFDIDFVAHEMGHQMGGDHTFDGTSNSNCNDNRVGSSAYEPGSGTTIMAYAGVCGAENIQPHSDVLFHSRSFDQIRALSSGSGACGTVTATGNTPPVPNAGGDFTIPQNTPFTLTGSGSDANGDSLTYAWEQYDLAGGIGQPDGNYDGPLFRSYEPSSSTSRTIPPMAALLAATATPWEVLPTKNRDLNFRLTVRDNRANGGGSDYDAMVVHVNGAPFRITGPNSMECGTTAALAWQVGGATDPNVQALLSTNNGANFGTTLLASTANDGSQTFNVPQTLTNQAWIKLAALGNIYFSLKGPMAISDTLAPSVTAPANLANVECTQCSPRGAAPSIGTATATDACDTTVAITNNAPSVFPLGTTSVTWTGRDDSNNSGSATQSVQVVDTTPPTIAAPGAITVECTGPAGTPVSLGTASVSDVCWCSQVNVVNNAPAVFPLGTTTVTWTATDGSGNSSTATQLVKVQDTTPPALTVSVTPDTLWSPNHKLVNIHVNLTTSDICDDTPTVRLLAVSSNEPDNGLGDGDTVGDVQGAAIGTDDRDFQVRAERAGSGTGRVYTIVYESRDDSGNATVREVTVTIPRNR